MFLFFFGTDTAALQTEDDGVKLEQRYFKNSSVDTPAQPYRA